MITPSRKVKTLWPFFDSLKEKAERIKYLEGEVKQFDMLVKEKNEALNSANKTTNTLKKQCEQLQSSLENSESKADELCYELLYRSGWVDMVSNRGLIRAQVTNSGSHTLDASRGSEETKHSGDIEVRDSHEVGVDLMIGSGDDHKRMRKLEEKLKENDRKLKEKTRTIWRLEKRCESLESIMGEAGTKTHESELQLQNGRPYQDFVPLSLPVEVQKEKIRTLERVDKGCNASTMEETRTKANEPEIQLIHGSPYHDTVPVKPPVYKAKKDFVQIEDLHADIISKN